ncbi:MAG: hypothetical protein KGN32_00325 [Burkholderiales bacterium]|nr:hypothetical protein [Burkholderiales bacterium]
MTASNLTPASPLSRMAHDWAQRAAQGQLTDCDYDRWFTMYPRAVAEATPEEAAALLDADCAVEAALAIH